MSGRGDRGPKRTVRAREIHLSVDGEEIALNGYVQDVFQETILALVRTLGTCDEDASIAVTIAPDASAGGPPGESRLPKRR